MASCRVCGGELLQGAAFCPHCGTRVEPDATDTAAIPTPPHETGPVPVQIGVADPHLFGVTPPLALLGLGLAATVVAILLLALGSTVLGIALVVVAALMLVAYLAAVGRKPDSAVVRLRERVRAGAESATARSTARRQHGRLLHEREQLAAARREALRALGEAVYAGDKGATKSLRAELGELDEAISAKEGEMTVVAERARRRVEAARLEVQPTEAVASVPEPAPSPVPAPVPHTPPDQPATPERGPEPSEPAPDPQPAPVPEPRPE